MQVFSTHHWKTRIGWHEYKARPTHVVMFIGALVWLIWVVDETLWAQLLTLLGDILSQQTHDPLAGIYMHIHVCNNNENKAIDLRVGRGIWKDLPGGKRREKYSKHIVIFKNPKIKLSAVSKSTFHWQGCPQTEGQSMKINLPSKWDLKTNWHRYSDIWHNIFQIKLARRHRKDHYILIK